MPGRAFAGGMRTRLALVVSVGVAGILTWSGAPAPGAAPGWSAPRVLSGTGSADEPQVATGAQGRAVVVWEQDTSQGSRIVASVRGTNGVWGALHGFGPVQDPGSSSQQVAMNDGGVAVATWVRSGRVFASVRTAGSWSPQRQISPGGGGAFPQAAVTAAGRVYVVWQQNRGVHEQVVVVRRSTSGAWSTPTVLPSGFGDGQYPQVAVDALGHATVAWQRMWADGGRTAVLVSRLADGHWTATHQLSGLRRNAGEPALAMDPRGDAVVVWSGRQAGRNVVLGVVRPEGGPWDAIQRVAVGSLADLALNRSGGAVVTWMRSTSSGDQFGISRRPPSGPWQQGAALGPFDPYTAAPRVATGGGAIALTWMTDAVQVMRGGGGTWGPKTTVGGSGTSYYQQVAMDPAGRAVVVWKEFDGLHDVVMMSASGPA